METQFVSFLIDSYQSDKQIAQRFKVSRATIWRWVKEGRFPKPIRLSPGCTRWKSSEVEEWEAAKRGKPSDAINRTVL